MPQRGANAWTDWGYSTPVRVPLGGAQTLTLAFTPLDENMDRRENTALLDHLRVTQVSACRLESVTATASHTESPEGAEELHAVPLVPPVTLREMPLRD